MTLPMTRRPALVLLVLLITATAGSRLQGQVQTPSLFFGSTLRRVAIGMSEAAVRNALKDFSLEPATGPSLTGPAFLVTEKDQLLGNVFFERGRLTQAFTYRRINRLDSPEEAVGEALYVALYEVRGRNCVVWAEQFDNKAISIQCPAIGRSVSISVGGFATHQGTTFRGISVTERIFDPR